ncbi:MAG: GNAT family N-acetyltransferase [Candidatus Sericytochromatia bacterium]|nr:GNAT family N-acetyltransferase [Candidatus Sericytochromatia bacterium]
MNEHNIKVLKSDEYTIKQSISELMTQSLIQEYSPPDNTNETIKELVNYYHSREDTVIFYIEVNSQVIGFSWLIKSIDIVTGKDFICILYLFVSEEFRSQKIGRVLFQKAVDYSKELKIDDVRLSVRAENTGAKKLYESIGFKVYKYEMKLDEDDI